MRIPGRMAGIGARGGPPGTMPPGTFCCVSGCTSVGAVNSKVIWIVPEFSVERYLPQLRALHASIEENGPFTATSERFLIECRRPA